MQTRTKKTLATGALGLAFAAAAAGTASATAPVVLGNLPVGSTTNLVPGADAAQNALANGASALNGTSALPAGSQNLLPSGNHLDGNQIAPVGGLIGGLPISG
ncbi:hypothetical protein, partial [Streptomyces sp. NRRL F-5123]|uniref:hypothetical protein n=1 Tax=Streptomyces sp. NRRL F-5123 TaxID=1463856 RepID=UPI0004E126E7